MHDTAHQAAGSAAQQAASGAGLGADRPGLTRRQVLARGAAGGAVLWAVPTLQIIGATAADAASGPVVPPPATGAVQAPATPTEGLPGHGIAVVDGGAGAFVVKIDSESPGTLSGLGNQDEGFLRDQRSLAEGKDYRQPTAEDLAAFGAAGNGFGTTWYAPAGSQEKQAALFLVLPSGFSVRHAFTFDGGLHTPGSNGNGNGNGNGKAKGPSENASETGQANAANGNGNGNGKAKGKDGCGDGDKYTAAHVSGRLVYFLASCNEPATGEA